MASALLTEPTGGVTMQTGTVNAWNEWDELEEIVVGIADDAHFEPTEPGNRPMLCDKQLTARFTYPKQTRK
jgi:glycine amidinotransferase